MDQGSEDHINARASEPGPAVPSPFEVASAFTKGLGGLLSCGFRSICGTYSRHLRPGTPSPRETVASAFCSIRGSCDVIELSLQANRYSRDANYISAPRGQRQGSPSMG